jgi:hypothetical protein
VLLLNECLFSPETFGYTHVCSGIHKPVTSIWNKGTLPQKQNKSVYVFINRVINLNAVTVWDITVTNCIQHFIQYYTFRVSFKRRRNCWVPRMFISTADQIFCIRQILGGCEYNGAVHQLFIESEQAYDTR